MRQRGARAWLLLAPALWLALACTAAARSLAEAQDGAGVAFSPRRSLAAAAAGPDCRVVHSACKSCRNVRLVVPGGSVRKTQLICTSCDSGWRLRKGDPRFCGEEMFVATTLRRRLAQHRGSPRRQSAARTQ